MTRTGALRIVRLSAPYDLLVTAPLALPWTAALVLTGLAWAHTGLGLDGVAPDPSNVYVVLFASLVGGLVTVWALVRLWRPTEEDVRRLRFLRRGQELGFPAQDADGARGRPRGAAARPGRSVPGRGRPRLITRGCGRDFRH
ncbi:hypothetical protein [Isoptericola sp. G70]|uniref:hypothetical protein n=1 Tax=Isoptericola sp. G70 TaxID=3376633 RepID=UPI003A8027DD